MIIKIILTMLLCIPFVCLQLFLIKDTINNIKGNHLKRRENNKKNQSSLRVAR